MFKNCGCIIISCVGGNTCCDDCWNLNLACKQFVKKIRIIKIRLFDRTLICNIAGGLQPRMPDSAPNEYKQLAAKCYPNNKCQILIRSVQK